MLILQTARLRLRWFGVPDADFLRRLLNDPGWLTHIGDRGVRTRRQAEHWIRNRHIETYGRHGFGFWAIERIEDGAVIGMAGLVKRDTLHEVDVGYALMPAYRGRGYAREAAAACLRYGHDVLGLPEIWAITGPDNAESAAVLAAIGLRDDGLHRLVGSEDETRLFKSPRHDPGDDRAQIDALVHRFLAAFTNRGGAIPTLAALPHHFLADATIRVADAFGSERLGKRGSHPGQPELPRGEQRREARGSLDIHGFIGPRAELLLRGRLQDFEEHETESRTEVDGAIAQRRLRYEKRGTLDGRPFHGAGTKLMQFARTPSGWKIASLLWSDDPPPAAD